MVTTRTTRTVEVAHAALAATARGRAGAPVVVLLHAGVADQRCWSACADELATTHHVVTYDRRGFGASTWTPSTFSPVEDLFAVLDAFGAPRAVLVGSSQGGRVALEAALARPARVDGLGLLAPSVTGAPAPDDADLDPGLIELDDAVVAAEERGELDLVNALEARMWLDGPLEPEGRVAAGARERFLRMNGRALAAADVGTPTWGHPPAWSRLAEVRAPVHVVDGALDVSYVRDRGEQVAARVPGATRVVLDGIAHQPMLERPAAVVAELRRLLARTT